MERGESIVRGREEDMENMEEERVLAALPV